MGRQCKIEGCTRPIFSDGWCAIHRPRCAVVGCEKYTREGSELCKEHLKHGNVVLRPMSKTDLIIDGKRPKLFIRDECDDQQIKAEFKKLHDLHDENGKLKKEPFYMMFDHSNPENSFVVNKDGTTDPPKKEEVISRSKRGWHQKLEVHNWKIKPEIKGSWYMVGDNEIWISDAELAAMRKVDHNFNPIKKIAKRIKATKQQKKQKIASIKKKLIEDFGSICMLSQRKIDKEALDAFHIFPIGKYPEYETEHWNILITTRNANRIWDQGTWDEISKMPGLQMLLKIIWDKDNDPNKKHKGSFYEQLMNRKNKSNHK